MAMMAIRDLARSNHQGSQTTLSMISAHQSDLQKLPGRQLVGKFDHRRMGSIEVMTYHSTQSALYLHLQLNRYDQQGNHGELRLLQAPNSISETSWRKAHLQHLQT
jgi:hypothetical protein